MKRLYYCLGSIVVLGIVFSGCYYFSYRQALNHFNERAEELDPSLLASELSAEKQQENQIQTEKKAAINQTDVASVDTRKQEIVMPTTQYILENYDVMTDKVIEETRNIPDYLLGLNREGVIGYLSGYMRSLPLEEQQMGLLSYELLSFSKDKLVIRKTYNQDTVPYKYCVVVREGMLVVYYCDKKTVYEYTGISSLDLPEEEQIKLMDGIYIENDEELYGLLENYSS